MIVEGAPRQPEQGDVGRSTVELERVASVELLSTWAGLVKSCL
jgi:hypothetical protein